MPSALGISILWIIAGVLWVVAGFLVAILVGPWLRREAERYPLADSEDEQ